MTRLGVAVSVLMVSVLGWGGAAAQVDPATGNEPLAVIGDRSISRARFEREMERRGAGLPGQYATPEDRRALLDELIRREALIASAFAAGYDRDPEVQAALERLIVARFQEDRLEPLLSDVAVTDDEVARFYEENKAAYARPERVQVAVVYFRVSPQAPEETRAEYEQRALAALDEAQALGESVRHFGTVARKYSDDRASRYKGGVIGWLSPDSRQTYKWDPAVLEAAFALEEPGQFAPLIATDEGFYLVRLVRREAAQTQPLAMLEDGFRYQLARRKQEQIRSAFVDELLSGITITVSEPLFATIGPPASAAAEEERQPPPLPER